MTPRPKPCVLLDYLALPPQNNSNGAQRLARSVDSVSGATLMRCGFSFHCPRHSCFRCDHSTSGVVQPPSYNHLGISCQRHGAGEQHHALHDSGRLLARLHCSTSVMSLQLSFRGGSCRRPLGMDLRTTLCFALRYWPSPNCWLPVVDASVRTPWSRLRACDCGSGRYCGSQVGLRCGHVTF